MKTRFATVTKSEKIRIRRAINTLINIDRVKDYLDYEEINCLEEMLDDIDYLHTDE